MTKTDGANRERIRVLGGIFVFALLLIAIAVWIAPKEQAYRLPDGTTVALMAWNYGKEHRLMRRSRKWPEFFLPAQQIENLTTPDDALVLWIYTSGKAVNRPNFFPSVHWWDWAEISDEQGHRIVSSNMDVVRPYSLLSTGNLRNDFATTDLHNEPFLINAFPRRGRTIIARFFVANRRQPVAVFTIPNPIKSHYSPEPAANVPQTARDGSVSCTFNGLSLPKSVTLVSSAGGTRTLSAVSTPVKPLPGETVGLAPILKFTENGKPSGNFAIAGVTLTDATGNTYPVGSMSQAEDGVVDLHAGFCSGEPTRMRVHVIRKTKGFEPRGNVWSPVSAPLPTNNSMVGVHTKIDAAGAVVRLLGVAGPGLSVWGKSSTDRLATNVYSARVVVTPADSKHTVFLKIMDDRARSVRCAVGNGEPEDAVWQPCFEAGQPSENVIVNYSYSLNGRSWSATTRNGLSYRTFFFIPRPGARSLQITGAVSRSYDFDFILPPQP